MLGPRGRLHDGHMTATSPQPALPSLREAPLPDLVRAYLERALPAGARTPTLVRLGQTGTMKLKPGGRDLRFDAVEDLATDEVAFAWKASVRIAPFVRIHVLDLRFGDDGDVVAAFGDRPRAEGRKAVTQPWVGLFGEYAELGGVRIPTRAEVRWNTPDGPFPYWRGRIVSLDAS
jgi:hypothetical protein